MRRILLTSLFAIAALVFAFNSNAMSGMENSEEKIALKVLYVGYSPDKPMPKDIVYYTTTPAITEKLYKARMADFKSFLENRFKEVKVIDVRDYKPEMSDLVDVTIMDAGPVKLPANFSRPMILMHAMAPNVGLPIGLKFDWYCQCLDDEALNVRAKHEIFNYPNKVKLTMVKKATPGSFFNGFQGVTTPKEMPMWKVVDPKTSADEKYFIGMVSHGEGFNDSPDAEAISGGVCLKNAEAVSLGRQGNYFMWGFSGSPDYMTDEAKDVFVNTVCYIKKYDHMPAIVKKVQIETREGIDELIYRISEPLYKAAIVSRQEGNARMLKLQQELKDKKAAGEDIGYGNEMFLKMPVTNDTQSFEDYLKGYVGQKLFDQYGINTKAYHKYYRDNYEYFYPSGVYSLQLDEDAQQLGISNRKIALLDKCVSMLEQNKSPEMARRLLERYTTEKFKTVAEWKAWLNTNRKNLFYTESGGFKFMVNTYGKAMAPQPSAVVSSGDKQTAVQPSNEPTATDPVAVSARLVPNADGKGASLVIDANILKGWHIYAFVAKNSPFIPTKTILELPDGVSASKEWQTTAAIPYPGDDQMFVFEGKASFIVALEYSAIKAGAKIRCGLSYQTCDETKCLQPQEKIIEIDLNTQSASFVAADKEIEKRSLTKADEQAAPFILKDLQGSTVALKDLKGKVVVLDFWATWCVPCKKSFPAMQMAVNKYKNDPEVKFLFIHTWETSKTPVADAKKYIDNSGFNFQVLMDTKDPKTQRNAAVDGYHVSSIPAKFIIDKKGNIAYRLTGFSGTNEDAVSELSAMIESAKQ